MTDGVPEVLTERCHAIQTRSSPSSEPHEGARVLKELLHRASDPSVRLTVDEGVRLYREAPPLHALRTGCSTTVECPWKVRASSPTSSIGTSTTRTHAPSIANSVRSIGHQGMRRSTSILRSDLRQDQGTGSHRRVTHPHAGGVNPDLGLDYYVDLLKHLRTTHPTIDLDCFSPIDIHGIASVTGQDLRSVLTVLKMRVSMVYLAVALRCWSLRSAGISHRRRVGRMVGSR